MPEEGLRIKIAEMIREKVDSIMATGSDGADVIILGDFNSTPDDLEIRALINGSESWKLPAKSI